jgi:hypothetical protein
LYYLYVYIVRRCIIMYILILLISIVLLIIIFLSIFPLNAMFSFNSEQLINFHLTLTWLKPLIKGIIKRHGNNTIITVYLLNRKVLVKNFSTNKSNGDDNKLGLIKSIKFVSITLQTSYGFEDPSITGMVCGAINMISEYIDSNDSVNNPDFSTDYDYFNFNVAVKVNVLVSFLNILKSKKSGLAMQELHVSK